MGMPKWNTAVFFLKWQILLTTSKRKTRKTRRRKERVIQLAPHIYTEHLPTKLPTLSRPKYTHVEGPHAYPCLTILTTIKKIRPKTAQYRCQNIPRKRITVASTTYPALTKWIL